MADTVRASVSPARNRFGSAKRAATGWLYATPNALFVVGIFLVPLGLVFQMSASDWSLLAGNRGWNLPQNYTDAIGQRLFLDSIWFTLKYTVFTTIILLGLAIALAMLVQESTRWKNLIRSAILIPSALGLASASLLFYALYSPTAGPFAGLMQRMDISVLGTPTSALWATIFLIVWRYAGFYMLLMMVGLQGISEDVYEAARLDGANRAQIFFRITLPLLRPTLALTLVMCVTGSLLAFDQFFILTKGGPDNSTMTIVQLIYSVAFQGQNNLGVAAALSVIVLIALVAINVVQMRVFNEKEK